MNNLPLFQDKHLFIFNPNALNPVLREIIWRKFNTNKKHMDAHEFADWSEGFIGTFEHINPKADIRLMTMDERNEMGQVV